MNCIQNYRQVKLIIYIFITINKSLLHTLMRIAKTETEKLKKYFFYI